mmetsp:Transcript_17217/g.36173  ORF Transcript_17217/g.36173 Transcript_17217/m.36173 type:complete len:212 (-) Transcript_17217:146-781(-)
MCETRNASEMLGAMHHHAKIDVLTFVKPHSAIHSMGGGVSRHHQVLFCQHYIHGTSTKELTCWTTSLYCYSTTCMMICFGKSACCPIRCIHCSRFVCCLSFAYFICSISRLSPSVLLHKQRSQSRRSTKHFIKRNHCKVWSTGKSRKLRRTCRSCFGCIHQHMPFVTYSKGGRLSVILAITMDIRRKAGFFRRRCGFLPIETISTKVAFQR